MTKDWRPITTTGALRAQWAILMVVVATLATVAFTIGYVARSIKANDRQWCALLRSLDQPLPASPKPTVRQSTIYEQIHALRLRKGC